MALCTCPAAARRLALPPPSMKRRRLIALILLILSVATSPFWVTFLVWQNLPWKAQRVELVDYSVPFETGREHRGAAWLLNHEKYQPYKGTHFAATGTHAGYEPTDRDHPRPISSLDLAQTDWIFVADAYGVYVDDMRDIEHEQAHMDYSKKIFGGLSLADAEAIQAHAARGRHTFLEFNSIEEPTTPEARAIVESLFGIHWTGWTGRSFLDLRDTTDVPWWLPREFKAQYGDIPMPRGPTLALVHRDGRLLLVPDPISLRVAPRIRVTDDGAKALPRASGGTSYFYWFPILDAMPGTEVLAELEFPRTARMDSVRALAQVPERIPLLTRRTSGGAHRVYLAGDLSDTDFDPGAYRFAGLARVHKALRVDPRIYNSQVAFWQFYVPAVRTLLQAPFAAP